MSEMRKLIESVEQIDEGYFSRLSVELDELYRSHPSTPDENLIAFVGRKYGDEAADFFRSQLESGEYEQSLEENDRYDDKTLECVHCGSYFCTSKFGGECPKIQKDMFDDEESIEEAWEEEEETHADMVEYWKGSLSRSIVRKKVFTQMYDAAGQDIDVFNRAIADQANSIADSYHGTGHGIGSSDQNHFIAAIAQDLGIDDIFGWYKKDEVEEDMRDIDDNPFGNDYGWLDAGIEIKGEIDDHKEWKKGHDAEMRDLIDNWGSEVGMASDEDMERDKTNRASRFRKIGEDGFPAQGSEQECAWWAGCNNEATTTEPHPILGAVPICDRCVDKLRKIEGLDEAKQMDVKYQGRKIGIVWQEEDGEWHGEHSGSGMSWATDNRKDMFARIKDHEMETLNEGEIDEVVSEWMKRLDKL